MKLLGVDYGTRRLGLALTDPAGTLAFPYKIIYVQDREQVLAEILAIIEQEGIEALVVGVPLGPEGPAASRAEEPLVARQARNFGERLGRRSGLPVQFVDERLSSYEAEDRLREAGLHGKALRQALDKHAAAVILETYLQGRQT